MTLAPAAPLLHPQLVPMQPDTLPLVCAVGLLNPIFDRQIVTQIGTLAVSGGVVSMLTLVMKGESIPAGTRWIGIPARPDRTRATAASAPVRLSDVRLPA